jgi:hypothetical protein
MVAALQAALDRHGPGLTRANLASRLDVPLEVDERAAVVFRNVTGRLGSTWYKRANPIQFEHPVVPRLGSLARLDASLFQPKAIKE